MDVEKGTITRRMDSVLNDLQDEFRVICDRSDFENRLCALKKAGSKSNRPSGLKKLLDLFDICGIQYELGKDNAYYEDLVKKSDIPTFFEAEDKMLYALYTRYKLYPFPEDYVKRMVDRLSSDEDHWDADPLRVRILK